MWILTEISFVVTHDRHYTAVFHLSLFITDIMLHFSSHISPETPSPISTAGTVVYFRLVEYPFLQTFTMHSCNLFLPSYQLLKGRQSQILDSPQILYLSECYGTVESYRLVEYQSQPKFHLSSLMTGTILLLLWKILLEAAAEIPSPMSHYRNSSIVENIYLWRT